MTDNGELIIEEAIIGAVKRLLKEQVNEILDRWQVLVPIIEFETFIKNNAVVPVVKLSECERTEKERIIFLDAYSLTIAFTVPETADSELFCYGYAYAVCKAFGENPTFVCRGLQKICGVTGCVVTPLTIGTAPLLLYLAMGSASEPVLVSETRNLFKYELNLLPMEDTEIFDVIQDRKNERMLFEGCRVSSYELRIMRGENVKLKLDIFGERKPRAFPYTDVFLNEQGEIFKSDNVTYKINGQEYTNIYGVTITSKKQGGTKTELMIKRSLQRGTELPTVINEMIITAKLIRDNYEYRFFGTFRITISKIVLVSDETEVNTSEAVISPLRYFVSGNISAEVFTEGGCCLE
ncbi:hypothetical protein [Treponema sp. R80B11-R83G3]